MITGVRSSVSVVCQSKPRRSSLRILPSWGRREGPYPLIPSPFCRSSKTLTKTSNFPYKKLAKSILPNTYPLGGVSVIGWE